MRPETEIPKAGVAQAGSIESRAQEMAELLNPNDGKPHPYIVDVFRKWLQAERDRALDDAATIPEKYGNGSTAREIRAKKSSPGPRMLAADTSDALLTEASSCRSLHGQSEVTPQGKGQITTQDCLDWLNAAAEPFMGQDSKKHFADGSWRGEMCKAIRTRLLAAEEMAKFL